MGLEGARAAPTERLICVFGEVIRCGLQDNTLPLP